MKKFTLVAVGLFLSASLLSGCIAILLGAGVAGGIVISQDTIRLQYDTNFDRAYRATHDALDKMGIINAEDKKAGTIVATIQDSHINARVIPVTSNAIRIEVKARKNLLPNLDLASKIINDINNRLHSIL
jgi:hypothetical protein